MENQKLRPKELIEELKKPIRYEFMGNEKAFEDNIRENIDIICDCLGLPAIKHVGGQNMITYNGFNIKPDIMVRHIDDSMTVFEVKKANEKYPCTGTCNQMNAIGQLLLYQSVLKRIINAPVRVALIDNKIYYRTFWAFIDNKLPITLIELQKDRLFIPYNGWV